MHCLEGNGYMKVGLLSLGCAKNQVDSEHMLYMLKEMGHTLVSND